MNTIIIETVD